MAVSAAAKVDKSQARFYDALRDLFVGAKVERESGFINLVRIKQLQVLKDIALKNLGFVKSPDGSSTQRCAVAP